MCIRDSIYTHRSTNQISWCKHSLFFLPCSDLRWFARELQRCFLRLIFYSVFWRSEERSWGPLGRSWRPKGSQMGLRREPKSWKKWSPAGFCFSCYFWSDFSLKNMSFSNVVFLMFFQCIVWPMEEGNAWAQRSKNLKICRRVSSKSRSSIF